MFFFAPFVLSFSANQERTTAQQTFFCLMAADAMDELFSLLESSFYATKSLLASEEKWVENRFCTNVWAVVFTVAKRSFIREAPGLAVTFS